MSCVEQVRCSKTWSGNVSTTRRDFQNKPRPSMCAGTIDHALYQYLTRHCKPRNQWAQCITPEPIHNHMLVTVFRLVMESRANENRWNTLGTGLSHLDQRNNTTPGCARPMPNSTWLELGIFLLGLWETQWRSEVFAVSQSLDITQMLENQHEYSGDNGTSLYFWFGPRWGKADMHRTW